MATFMDVNRVMYVAPSATEPLCDLYFCRHCFQLRSRACVSHEVCGNNYLTQVLLIGFIPSGLFRVSEVPPHVSPLRISLRSIPCFTLPISMPWLICSGQKELCSTHPLPQLRHCLCL